MNPLSDQILALRPLVILVGPTAVGKSEIAVKIASALETEILAADSRQVYRGMDIATDKPSQSQRHGIPHRLIDLADPDEAFNTGIYRERALAEIGRLHAERRLPLIVGGTGLYVRTLVKGLCDAPHSHPAVRAQLLGEARVRGKGYLYDELTRVDPEAAKRLHPNDEVKIVRALEVFHLSGKPLSEIQREHRFVDRQFSPCLLGLSRDRDVLYQRIDRRVDWFFTHGLVDETRALLGKGYHRELSSMKGLGYKQVAAYLAGEYDYAEAVRRLKRDTRRFAKRQLTWFRKEPEIIWTVVDERDSPDRVAAELRTHITRFLTDLSRRLPHQTATGPVRETTAVG